MKPEIDKLALVCIKHGRLLCARSKGKELFYIPGGKREPGESDYEALTREIQEELTVTIKPNSIKLIGVFSAKADDKPAGTIVKVTCYLAEFDDEPKANAEIAELVWLTAADHYRCSTVTREIMRALADQGLLISA